MNKTKSWMIPVTVITFCIAAVLGYFTGRTGIAKPKEDVQQVTDLQLLNRETVMHMSPEGTIHVIGHMSPDSDTVITAITYAKLLNLLGYDAVANITEPVNRETAYILEQAGIETPEVLLDASGESIFLVDHSEYAQAL